MTATVNISLPKTMYVDAKKIAIERKYTSLSEFIRDALRRLLYPELTVNGFTPEFEEKILEAVKEPEDNFVEWDPKTPFSKFIQNHPSKSVKFNHGKNHLRRNVLGNIPRFAPAIS